MISGELEEAVGASVDSIVRDATRSLKAFADGIRKDDPAIMKLSFDQHLDEVEGDLKKLRKILEDRRAAR